LQSILNLTKNASCEKGHSKRIIISLVVKIYTRETCAPCRTLKYWLKSKNIPFSELSPEGTDVQIVPTILIGEEKIIGLDFKRLSDLLL